VAAHIAFQYLVLSRWKKVWFPERPFLYFTKCIDVVLSFTFKQSLQLQNNKIINIKKSSL